MNSTQGSLPFSSSFNRSTEGNQTVTTVFGINEIFSIANTTNIEKRKKQAFVLKMQRFDNRLANFINTGTWKKTNKEIKIIDDENILYKLLLSLTKENQIIQASFTKFFNEKSEERELLDNITIALTCAQDAIQNELKNRQDKLRRRKMLFLLEEKINITEGVEK